MPCLAKNVPKRQWTVNDASHYLERKQEVVRKPPPVINNASNKWKQVLRMREYVMPATLNESLPPKRFDNRPGAPTD